KEQNGVGSNTVRKSFRFRNAEVRAVSFGVMQGVTPVEGAFVKFTEDGSWMALRDTDLSGIKSINMKIEARQRNGELWIVAGSPGGKVLGKIAFSKKAAEVKNKALREWEVLRAELTPSSGRGDVYVVFRENGKAAPA